MIARIRALARRDAAALGQWGEALGMACSLLPDPLSAMRAIRHTNANLALRVLGDVDQISAADALAFIDGIEDGWDGDTLLRAVGDRPGAAEALWAWVTPAADLDRLAWLHYALTAIEGEVDRARFFGACDRWPAADAPASEWVRVPAGHFQMGTPAAERATLPEIWQDSVRENEATHWVTLTTDFLLARCPVTISEYQRFDPNHRRTGGPSHPVRAVSWWRARLYAAWAGCVLPTEAQWERACRAGTRTKYWSGETEADLRRIGWYEGNSGGQTHPVGKKPANPYGLHDMHGNVWEWCGDWFAPYPGGPSTDPTGAPTGAHRVLRGGSYWNLADYCRSANRNWTVPGNRDGIIGFRLARPAPALDL
ncbi:MAG: formylglycine-generating enzyme family protein [Myxococcales bacterium]|nr:formylglycine-generating enzyme family protein [Myxococcales bacterium]